MGSGFFQVGVVTGAVGLKGEVRVYPTTDDPSRFRDLAEVYIEDRETAFGIQGLRFQKNMVVLKLAGVDTVGDAEMLKGMALRIPPEQALPLEEGQYYHRDLLGIRVFDNDGCELGILTDILSTAANDVYVIKRPDKAELLLPAIKQCVLSVDIINKRMTARLLPGLDQLTAAKTAKPKTPPGI